MTHCRSTSEKCSASCADGSAMFMIVISSTIISWASPTTPSTNQRRRPGSPAWPAEMTPPGMLPADLE